MCTGTGYIYDVVEAINLALEIGIYKSIFESGVLRVSRFMHCWERHCVSMILIEYIYIYIYIPGVTLNNVTPPNNLLLNSYFENLSVELCILNMHANFHDN